MEKEHLKKLDVSDCSPLSEWMPAVTVHYDVKFKMLTTCKTLSIETIIITEVI